MYRAFSYILVAWFLVLDAIVVARRKMSSGNMIRSLFFFLFRDRASERYTADVAASLNVSAAVMRVVRVSSSVIPHPSFPLPLRSLTDFAGENLRLHIETISKSIDRSNVEDQAQGYSTVQ